MEVTQPLVSLITCLFEFKYWRNIFISLIDINYIVFNTCWLSHKMKNLANLSFFYIVERFFWKKFICLYINEIYHVIKKKYNDNKKIHSKKDDIIFYYIFIYNTK